MKTIISIAVFTAYFLQCGAQEQILPMIEEGRVYNIVSLVPTTQPEGEPGPGVYQYLNGGWYNGYRHNYIIEGEAVVDGKTYKRFIDTDDNSCFRLLRQDDEKIYMRYGDNSNIDEMLIFDFSLKEGEFLSGIISETGLKVVKIDTVCVNGCNRKRMAMSLYNPDYPESDYSEIIDYWIEGIGCIGGPIDTYWWEMIGPLPMVVNCYQGEELLFSYKDYVAPPISSDIHITTIKDNATNELFDLQGIKRGNDARGIVVRDGRKVVVQPQ